MPADLVVFMRWIGLLEVAAQPQPAPCVKGKWYRDGDVPFLQSRGSRGRIASGWCWVCITPTAGRRSHTPSGCSEMGRWWAV